MKSFKEFIFEYKSVVQIDTTGSDVTIPNIKAELNRNIDLILSPQFLTIYEALNKVRKILSMYSLNLPQISVQLKTKDIISSIVGHQNIIQDELKGELSELNPFIFDFSYELIDGLYKCSGELK